MVLHDIVIAFKEKHPAGCHDLSQPALAKVNRQLRSEVLPMWYRDKTFGIRIQPRRHSEIDQVWQRFLDRFKAHTAGADGSHYLSSIKRINVVLCNPALEPGFNPADSRLWGELEQDPSYRYYRRTGEIPRDLSNCIELQFGPKWLWELDGRATGNIIDWTDRVAVRATLEAGITERRCGNRSKPRLDKFWETYPFERLVDLAMMIGSECKDAARFLNFGVSLAHLDARFRYGYWERYAVATLNIDAQPSRIFGTIE